MNTWVLAASTSSMLPYICDLNVFIHAETLFTLEQLRKVLAPGGYSLVAFLKVLLLLLCNWNYSSLNISPAFKSNRLHTGLMCRLKRGGVGVEARRERMCNEGKTRRGKQAGDAKRKRRLHNLSELNCRSVSWLKHSGG